MLEYVSKMLLGCDPEFFFVDGSDKPTYDEKFIPGVGFALSPAVLEKYRGLTPLVEDEKHPLYIDVEMKAGNHFRFVGDGVAIELNFANPFRTLREMFDGVQEAKAYLKQWSMENFGLEVADCPTVNFDYRKWWTKELMKDPRFQMGIIFGCDPDKDAFDSSYVCEIQNVTQHPARYGGGHIHMSGIPEMADYIVPFVQLLGITAGNFLNSQTEVPDLLARRAVYYGKPGKYRLQSYKNGSSGVEYRSPSNEWTAWSEGKLGELFVWIDKAVYLLMHREEGRTALSMYSERTLCAMAAADATESNRILSALA